MAFDPSFHFAFRFETSLIDRLRVRFNRGKREIFEILYNLVTCVIAILYIDRILYHLINRIFVRFNEVSLNFILPIAKSVISPAPILSTIASALHFDQRIENYLVFLFALSSSRTNESLFTRATSSKITYKNHVD